MSAAEASPADREFASRFCDSLEQPVRHRASRRIRTFREFFWHKAPRLSIWNAGVWTLDLLSLHFVFEGVNTEQVRVDPGLEGKLQDLFHDPAVLAYKRKIDDLGER